MYKSYETFNENNTHSWVGEFVIVKWLIKHLS